MRGYVEHSEEFDRVIVNLFMSVMADDTSMYDKYKTFELVERMVKAYEENRSFAASGSECLPLSSDSNSVSGDCTTNED